jgi:hypothetical protein
MVETRRWGLVGGNRLLRRCALDGYILSPSSLFVLPSPLPGYYNKVSSFPPSHPSAKMYHITIGQ